MIAFNRGEIGGLPALPVRHAGAPEAPIEWNGLFAPTGHENPLSGLPTKKVRLSGPAPRIFLQEEAPLISAGMGLAVVGSISAVRHIPSSKLVARGSRHDFEGSRK